ncbi:porin [Vibrio sinaloensis]|uniref:Membrane protein n=1 Tax=Photobacterium sp. (strain ATCC 43367) TaxID=379097 RepID=A0A0A5I1D9_PHOS4|nr:porin [Vibrio sinaloensis]KGY09559.1 membrane protein [Vibrio sinaloensis]KHT52774.1 membrane protein [Vibrio sinaloensis]
MKKTLVALSVLMAATSAQAIELYNQDGATVNMGGDIEVRYKKDTAKDSEFKQEIDDSDLNFDIRYAVNDQLSVGGYWELNDLATKDGEGGDAYVSFITTEFGTVKIGKTATQLDDAGVGSDYLFGIESFVEATDFSGDEVVRYDLDKGNFYFGLAAMQDKANEDLVGEDGNYFDFKAGYRVADFDLSAFYGKAKLRGSDDDGAVEADLSIGALQATYGGIENLNLEVGYYKAEESKADTDAQTFAFAADYTMDKVKFAGGISSTDYSVSSKEDHKDWFINAGYTLAPNTTVYAEVGGNDKEESETGFGVGIKSSF